MKLRTLTRIIPVVGLLLSASTMAQETTMGDMLNLESRVTVSKMKEELAKSSPPEVKTVTLPKLDMPSKPVVLPPRTVAIYGMEPNYQGLMDFNGSVVTVSKGSQVFGKVVSDVSVHGVTLSTPAPMRAVRKAKRGKQRVVRASANSGTTSFYPIAAR